MQQQTHAYAKMIVDVDDDEDECVSAEEYDDEEDMDEDMMMMMYGGGSGRDDKKNATSKIKKQKHDIKTRCDYIEAELDRWYNNRDDERIYLGACDFDETQTAFAPHPSPRPVHALWQQSYHALPPPYLSQPCLEYTTEALLLQIVASASASSGSGGGGGGEDDDGTRRQQQQPLMKHIRIVSSSGNTVDKPLEQIASTILFRCLFETCFFAPQQQDGDIVWDVSSAREPAIFRKSSPLLLQQVLDYLAGMLQNTCSWNPIFEQAAQQQQQQQNGGGGGGGASASGMMHTSVSSGVSSFGLEELFLQQQDIQMQHQARYFHSMPCPRSSLAAWTVMHFELIVALMVELDASAEAWRRWMCGLIQHLPTGCGADMRGSASHVASYQFLAYAIALGVPDDFGLHLSSQSQEMMDESVRAWKMQEFEKTRQTRTDLVAHLLGAAGFETIGWRIAKSVIKEMRPRPFDFCMLPIGMDLGADKAANFYAFCYPWLDAIVGKAAVTGSAFYQIQSVEPGDDGSGEALTDEIRCQAYLEFCPTCDLNIVLRPHYVDTVGEKSVVRAARILVEEIEEVLMRKWRASAASSASAAAASTPPQIRVEEGLEFGRIFMTYQHNNTTYRKLSISVLQDEGVEQGLYSTCVANEVVVIPLAPPPIPSLHSFTKQLQQQRKAEMETAAFSDGSSADKQKRRFFSQEERARFDHLVADCLKTTSSSLISQRRLREAAEKDAWAIILQERERRLGRSGRAMQRREAKFRLSGDAQHSLTNFVAMRHKHISFAVLVTNNFKTCMSNCVFPLDLAEKRVAMRVRKRELPSQFEFTGHPETEKKLGRYPQLLLDKKTFKVYGRVLEHEDSLRALSAAAAAATSAAAGGEMIRKPRRRFPQTLAEHALVNLPVDEYRHEDEE